MHKTLIYVIENFSLILLLCVVAAVVGCDDVECIEWQQHLKWFCTPLNAVRCDMCDPIKHTWNSQIIHSHQNSLKSKFQKINRKIQSLVQHSVVEQIANKFIAFFVFFSFHSLSLPLTRSFAWLPLSVYMLCDLYLHFSLRPSISIVSLHELPHLLCVFIHNFFSFFRFFRFKLGAHVDWVSVKKIKEHSQLFHLNLFSNIFIVVQFVL